MPPPYIFVGGYCVLTDIFVSNLKRYQLTIDTVDCIIYAENPGLWDRRSVFFRYVNPKAKTTSFERKEKLP